MGARAIRSGRESRRFRSTPPRNRERTAPRTADAGEAGEEARPGTAQRLVPLVRY